MVGRSMDAYSKATDMIWNRDEGDKSESPAKVAELECLARAGEISTSRRAKIERNLVAG
jgi:hypothetical protein